MKMRTLLYCVCVLYMKFYLALGSYLEMKAVAYSAYTDLIEINGAIDITAKSSLVRCLKACIENDQCLTYFYNANTTRCVMHSKHFVYQAPSVAEIGWKYYITEDLTGRCPSSYLYYRPLDFCYAFDEIGIIDFTKAKENCGLKSGSLAAVTTKVKHSYFRHIMQNRPYSRVLIAGSRNYNTEWFLDDGSTLTYFDWYPGQPDYESFLGCLELHAYDQFWDIPCDGNGQPGVFVCERKKV